LDEKLTKSAYIHGNIWYTRMPMFLFEAVNIDLYITSFMFVDQFLQKLTQKCVLKLDG